MFRKLRYGWVFFQSDGRRTDYYTNGDRYFDRALVINPAITLAP
jgi:hypothetical protein